MVLFEDIDDFEKKAERFLRRNKKARIFMKYVGCKSLLIVKVTNDIECYRFQTNVQSDMERLETFLNNTLAPKKRK